MIWLLLGSALAWPLKGPQARPTGQEVEATDLFEETEWSPPAIHSDPNALGRVAARTLAWMDRHAEDDPEAVHAGVLGELGITLEDVRKTLAFIAKVAEEDRKTGAARLKDPAFVTEHFRYIRWDADDEMARAKGMKITGDALRLTKYLVYKTEGSLTRTDTFGYALYAAPSDDSHRPRWKRSDVLGGVYEAGGAAEGAAEPLVWVRRKSVHDAIMQGTIEVTWDGGKQLFNVDKVNDIPFDRRQKDPEKQGRYWYFKKVKAIGGWGGTDKIGLEPMVSVAGDVYNLGLGKVIALEQPDGVRLAVLSDTGGAFQPNLYQLDLLAGTFPSYPAFTKATQGIATRVTGGILIVR